MDKENKQKVIELMEKAKEQNLIVQECGPASVIYSKQCGVILLEVLAILKTCETCKGFKDTWDSETRTMVPCPDCQETYPDSLIFLVGKVAEKIVQLKAELKTANKRIEALLNRPASVECPKCHTTVKTV